MASSNSPRIRPQGVEPKGGSAASGIAASVTPTLTDEELLLAIVTNWSRMSERGRWYMYYVTNRFYLRTRRREV